MQNNRITVNAASLVASALVLGAGALMGVMAGGLLSSPATARELDTESGKPAIATCALMKVVDELMETERFRPARVDLEDTLRKEKLDPIVEQLKEIQAKSEGMSREDPGADEIRERYGRLQREAQRAQQEIVRAVEQKVAEQLSECFQLVRQSAEAVAEDLGYAYVIASTDPDTELKMESVVSLVRDFLARPVLVAPKGVDITEEVRRDLKLE